MSDAAPTDLTINAISDPTRTGALNYQKNWIEELYNQDCGGYSLSLVAVDTSCDMSNVLTIAAPSSTGGARNQYTYSDQMTLES